MTVTVRPLHNGIHSSERCFPPFSEAVERNVYYPTETHEEALARLLYLVEEHQRCGVLTGEAGTGKTMVFHRLEKLLRRAGTKVVRVDLAGAGEGTVLHRVAVSLGLNPADNESVESLIDDLELVFTSAGRVRYPWVILFDHADRLRPGALAAIEQLLHLSSTFGAVFLFATRPEGRTALLKTLGEHAGLRIELAPLEAPEIGSYLDEALEHALVSTVRFTRDAVQLIARMSGGNMRKVNRLSHAACLAAATEHHPEVDAELILAVGRELS